MFNETLDSFPIAENESALANDLYTFPVKAMVKICHLKKSLEWFCMQASDRKVKRAKWKESKFVWRLIAYRQKSRLMALARLINLFLEKNNDGTYVTRNGGDSNAPDGFFP